MLSEMLPEQLAPGLSYYQRLDGIHVYEFRDMTRATIDAAFTRMTANDQQAFQENRHARAMYLVKASWVISPYLISKSIEISSLTPAGLRESVAVVGDALVLRLVSIILGKVSAQTQQAHRVFTSEDEAIRWLDERLDLLGD